MFSTQDSKTTDGSRAGRKGSSFNESDTVDDWESDATRSETILPSDIAVSTVNLETEIKVCLNLETVAGEHRKLTEHLRAPVLCVLGHVDAGKTTFLDNLRGSHVQNHEAGGITQQIGATNIPLETIRERTKMSEEMLSSAGHRRIPGFVILDTPGHEVFQNLRLRGSSLCDLVILVVDIMHGLAPQTIECIQLLVERQIPFVIALNKIDRLYGWQTNREKDVRLVLGEQPPVTQHQFEKRCNEIIVQFAIQDVNAALYYKNPDPNEFYSMVPISARSGDGMGSLIACLIAKSQTTLAQHLIYSEELQATVMEVKTTTRLGTTIDVVLVNGHLSVGDRMVIAGQEGPIVTQIRGLCVPVSNEELRVTHKFENVHRVVAACGVRVLAKDLDRAMAGLPLFVVRDDTERDHCVQHIEQAIRSALSAFRLKEKGVYVQASTFGSLEALVKLLEVSKIPYAGVNIGPVHRKDVMRASAQLENDERWAAILAFDVQIERDAQEQATNLGVRIYQDDDVYQLVQKFIRHHQERKEEEQERQRHLAVFPCKLQILPDCVFGSRDPIIIGVRVVQGFIKVGTPICVPSKEMLDLGRVVSMQMKKRPVDIAREGAEVCIKIEPSAGASPPMYGRHFDHHDLLISRITRPSIDVVKEYFRDEMTKTDWLLMIELKKLLNII